MSNLAHLLQAYRNHPAVKKIAQNFENQTSAARIQLTGLIGAQESFVLAGAYQSAIGSRQPTVHLFIANSKEEAAYRHNDLEGLLANQPVHFFPDSFKRPAFFDDLNPTQVLQRSEVISKMTSQEKTNAVIVTYPEALFEKVVKPEVLNKSRVDILKGAELDADFLIEVLVDYGFERTDFVY